MNAASVENRLREVKQQGRKIVCLTAYDASFARVMETAGVDVVLVGDSLGMVLKGDKDTLGVSMDDMVYHTRLASRGLKQTLLVADLPHDSYNQPATALSNARRLVQEGGAGMVKLEGGREVLPQIRAIIADGIPVCGHLGLQPQSVHKYGGYRVQGRDPESAARIREDAVLLAEAGVGMIVLECIPRSLARAITADIPIPTIGIGAGLDCDGQVLVIYDVVGLSEYIPKIANDFLRAGGSIEGAIREYVDAVRTGRFPGDAQGFD